MGDRGNIAIIDGGGRRLYVYSHWGGERLPQTLGDALDTGRADEADYLAAQIARWDIMHRCGIERADLERFRLGDLARRNTGEVPTTRAIAEAADARLAVEILGRLSAEVLGGISMGLSMGIADNDVGRAMLEVDPHHDRVRMREVVTSKPFAPMEPGPTLAEWTIGEYREIGDADAEVYVDDGGEIVTRRRWTWERLEASVRRCHACNRVGAHDFGCPNR